MASSLGACCLSVADLDHCCTFFEGLGFVPRLSYDTRNDARLAVGNPRRGGVLQFAVRSDQRKPLRRGNAFRSVALGTTRTDVGASVRGPDGLTIEVVGSGERAAWIDSAVLSVSDLAAARRRYTQLGLRELARSGAAEVTFGRGETGGRLRLVEVSEPIEMGAFWKLYLHTDDCRGLYTTALDVGCTGQVPPAVLDRFGVTAALVQDPDGYGIELVEHHTRAG